MARLTEHEEAVGRYYDEPIYAAELDRLLTISPVELALTARWLERLIPAGATVGEIGVGGAHYTERLARRGCRLRLADVSARLLENAVARLREAGLCGRLLGAHHEAAGALASFAAETCDAALFLGPFYHLCTAGERDQVVSEAARILRPGGLLFAAGINRLSYLRELYHREPHLVLVRKLFHEEFLRDGNIDPAHAPPIGYAHMTTAEDFRALFAGRFEQVTMAGVESFTNMWQKAFADLPPEEASAWLDLVEATGATAEGLGHSDHYLYIGRKR